MAAARLLADPGYTGETLEPIPNSSLTIEVMKDPEAPFEYLVRCEARYPADRVTVVVRQATRRFHRVADADKVRLETVAGK